MTTVVGLYDDIQDTQRTVQDLVGHGFARRDINLITNDVNGDFAQYLNSTQMKSLASEGTGGGAIIGGLAGLLVGLGAVVIPGIGPALAAGPLFGIMGAGLGAVTGGVLGSLVEAGVPKDTVAYFAEGVRRGGTLVLITADEKLAERAEQIINRHGPVDLARRISRWREGGWSQFDPDAQPYPANDIARERELATTYNDRINNAGVG